MISHIPARRRRSYTPAFRLQVIAETRTPGTSVAEVARRHDVPRQSLYQWRRDVQRKALSESLGVTFIPVASMAEPLRTTPTSSMGAVEITLRNGRGLRGITGMAETELTHLIRVVGAGRQSPPCRAKQRPTGRRSPRPGGNAKASTHHRRRPSCISTAVHA